MYASKLVMSRSAVRVRSSALFFTCKTRKKVECLARSTKDLAAVDFIPRPCPSCRRRVFPCWVASVCSGSLLGCLRGAWWVVRTSQRTVRTGDDLMNRFLATPGEELEVKVALGKRLRVNVLLTEPYTRYVLQSARSNLRRRPNRGRRTTMNASRSRTIFSS